jgi:hypothetical protein
VTDLSTASVKSGWTAHFRMVSVVRQLGARLDPGHDFRFNFSKPRPVVVHFNRDERDPDAAVCVATCVAQIDTTIATKLASPFKDDIAALGSLSSPELSALDDILLDLRTLLRSTFDLFRWRNGLAYGPINVAQNAFYSGDGIRWLKVSLARRIDLGVGMAFKKSLKDVPPEEIVRMVESGQQEPVAHQLFREAWELRSSNPRSAIAIGIAAAEIGVKDLIAVVVPNAHWLVKETPSPPVVRILREYLPMLPVRGRFQQKNTETAIGAHYADQKGNRIPQRFGPRWSFTPRLEGTGIHSASHQRCSVGLRALCRRWMGRLIHIRKYEKAVA